MPNTQMFNKAELLENLDGDEEFAESILGDAVIEIPKAVEQLKESFKAGDLQSISIIGHTIKGMAANLCTPALRDIAFKIETAAKEGEVELARSYLPELEQTAQLTVEAIKV